MLIRRSKYRLENISYTHCWRCVTNKQGNLVEHVDSHALDISSNQNELPRQALVLVLRLRAVLMTP